MEKYFSGNELIYKTNKILVYKKIINKNEYIIKKFMSLKELNNELIVHELLKANNVNLALEIKEITEDNCIVYSMISGKKLSEIENTNKEIYYKIGKELAKFHNISIEISRKMEPIFYQIQIINELKRIYAKNTDENVIEIINYIRDNLDRVDFRKVKFGLTIYKMNREDIIIDENGEVNIVNYKEISYNNQEMNFNILYSEIIDENNIESFFKGYCKYNKLDKDFLKRFKIFTLFLIIRDRNINKKRVDNKIIKEIIKL